MQAHSLFYLFSLSIFYEYMLYYLTRDKFTSCATRENMVEILSFDWQIVLTKEFYLPQTHH